MVEIIKSFYRYFKWILFSDKRGVVPESIYEKRISICKECEHYFNPTMQCKICKCFMFMKAKVINTNCPINKWGTPSNAWGEEIILTTGVKK